MAWRGQDMGISARELLTARFEKRFTGRQGERGAERERSFVRFRPDPSSGPHEKREPLASRAVHVSFGKEDLSSERHHRSANGALSKLRPETFGRRRVAGRALSIRRRHRHADSARSCKRRYAPATPCGPLSPSESCSRQGRECLEQRPARSHQRLKFCEQNVQRFVSADEGPGRNRSRAPLPLISLSPCLPVNLSSRSSDSSR